MNRPHRGRPQRPKKDLPNVRVKYSAPSRSFVQWVRSIEFEKTIFGRALLLLEGNFALRYTGLLFLFCLALAYLINFDLDFGYQLRVGEISPTNIKSPMKFEMVDDMATEEKRIEAERSIPPIFDYDLTLYDKVTNDVYRAFRFMREKIASLPKAQRSHPESIAKLFEHKAEFEDLLNQRVSDHYFEWLIKQRFNSNIEGLVIRTLEKWSDQKLASGIDRTLNSGDRKLIIRIVSERGGGEEFTVTREAIRDIENKDKFSLGQLNSSKEFSDYENRRILKFARSLLVPNLTLNKQETAVRREKARKTVPPVLISIKKNQLIVQEGTVVQPLHVALLAEIRNHQSDRYKGISNILIALLFLTMIMVFYSYTRRFTLNRVRVDLKEVVAMCMVSLFIVAMTKVFLFMTQAAFLDKYAVIPANFFLYLAPVASGPMLVGLLIASGEMVWFFTFFLAAALAFAVDLQLPFVLLTVVGGIAAARGVYGCKKRNDIYKAGIHTGIVNALVILFAHVATTQLDPAALKDLLWIVPAGLAAGIFSSFIAMMLVPLLETMFNFTTDIKLLELSNLNHPLMKEMVVKAPGTYHHSLVVGSMVEAAAEAIGANSLLAKVMSYYHDIGKMKHPQYFIENQRPGHNPHDHLSPNMSKTVLVAHVKDGVEMGMKQKLGKPIIDGIEQHHGTTLIAYFYNKALEMAEDESDVVEDEFRYPGPKPQFREAALVMLADSIEAAARSLDEPTPMRLRNIVKTIIQRKFMEGQLDECDLTLKELNGIEAEFYRILLSVYHMRIDYPKQSPAPKPVELRANLPRISEKPVKKTSV